MTDPRRRALVWIDHHEARIIHPLASSTEFDVTVVAGDDGQTHERKHDGGHRHPISAHFTDRIALALLDSSDVAVVGPSTAKAELMTQLRERHRDLAGRVTTVEALDRETDPQLASHARILFARTDAMHGIHVPQKPD
ncbi:MAG: hypothetical protein M3Y87_02165 [Myxococcota bacterium]|nr:hypothetical protein [Myxococcota bacterium]